MANKKTHTTKGLRPPKRHAAKAHAKVYWPYLPLVALLIGGLFLNVWQPLQGNKPATLAYATEMSRSGLLSSTNSKRSANGVGSLTANSQLNSAAQAKANDMVARDYWSHNTPDGNPPWVFIDAQGYAYTKAGENLAYGFSTSSATVTGWMNSPSHKANMLDGAFTEVGFGFANSSDYVGTGEETVVVAMYAKPVATSAPAPAPVSTQSATPQTAPASTQNPAPAQEASQAPTDIDSEPDPEPTFEPVDSDRYNQPVNTDNPIPDEPHSQRITLLQQFTGGDAPWSAVLVSTAAFGISLIWLFKHFLLVRRFVIEGEHFVAHHPVLDLTVVSIIAFAVYLSQSSGVIQ